MTFKPWLCGSLLPRKVGVQRKEMPRERNLSVAISLSLLFFRFLPLSLYWCMAFPHASVVRVYFSTRGRRPSGGGSGSRSSIIYRTEKETRYSGILRERGDPLAESTSTLVRVRSMRFLNNVFDLRTILWINYSVDSCRACAMVLAA